jgi:hypothetical protein
MGRHRTRIGMDAVAGGAPCGVGTGNDAILVHIRVLPVGRERAFSASMGKTAPGSFLVRGGRG